MLGSKHVMATHNINGLDYCFVRTVGCLAVHITSMLILKKDWRYPIQDFGWVMTRNIGGTVVIISLIYAMQYLPMGIYQIIYNTSPFWASLLAYITLGENLKQVEIMAMVLSFLLIMMLFISRQQSQGAPTLL